MAVYTILKATEADAVELGPRLRAGDLAECDALRGPGMAIPALIESVNGAAEAWTGRADGEIVCMWGVNPATLIGRIGVPWLLSSELVPLHRKTFLRENRRWLPHALDLFPTLGNVVLEAYAEAVRWLRWLGFMLHAPQALGLNGERFLPFSMERP